MRRTIWLAPMLAAAAAAYAPAASATDGKALFQSSCMKCHGATLASDTPAGQKIKVPALNGVKLTPDQIVRTVRQNRKHVPVSKKVSDGDLQAIATYMATLGAQ